MKISIRLSEVLRKLGEKDRGTASRIATYSRGSLTRHQVSDILNNRTKSPFLNTLAGICEYLVNCHHVDRSQLPGLLLRLEPEALMSLVAGQTYLGVCVGMRIEDGTKATGASAVAAGADVVRTKRQSVTAADAYLLGVVMHELFGGRTPAQEIDQRLIAAYGLESDETHAGQQAAEVYRDFRKARDETGGALVCLGSVKSNPVAEFIMADIFGAKQFKQQDGIGKPEKRACPVFLQYREDDFSPPSCHGGQKLARGRRTNKPGIYFERADKSWEYCPSTPEDDAAFIVYAHHIPESRVEMIMGGFSSRATFCLATALPRLLDSLWPPSYDTDQLQVGAFVVRFSFTRPNSGEQNGQDSPWTVSPANTKVVALDESVLKRRLEK